MAKTIVHTRHLSTGESYFGSPLKPSQFYVQPRDVVSDRRLTLSEKRAVLASWASDACAVDSVPTLRSAPWSSSVVTFDDVMAALQELDRDSERRTPADAKRRVGEGSNAGV